jgi:tRNA A-37 threonylcarbamoyl transferase component Bud32
MGRSDKVDMIILPTYEAVTALHTLLCITGIIILSIGLPVEIVDEVTNVLHIVIAYVPLILVHMKTLPTSIGLYTLYFIVVALATGFGVLDLELDQPYWSIIVGSTYILVPLVTILLLFRKHFRINRNPSIVVHTILTSIYMFLMLVYRGSIVIFDYPLSRAMLVAKILFIFVTISGFFVKYRDTKIWRGIVKSEELQLIEYDMQEPLHISNTNIRDLSELIEDYASAFIDFGYVHVKNRIAVGGRSTVYLGKYKEIDVIIKVLRPPEITSDVIQHWHREISIGMKNNHENVVKAYGIVVVPPRVMLIFEYCKRTLTDYIDLVSIRLTFGLSLMLDVSKGVEYLHSRDIIHRDLKTDNVIMCHCGCLIAKIIDFGESRVQTIDAMTVIGTPHYMAPEILVMQDGQSHYDKSVDVFSLAIIFWEILHEGQETHPADWTIANILTGVKTGFRPKFNSDIQRQCPALCELIEHMWREEPFERPSSYEVRHCIEQIYDDRLSRAFSSVYECTRDDALDLLVAEGHCTRRTEAKKLLKYAQKNEFVIINDQ